MAKVAQKPKQAEITEQDSLLLTRNLLRIAIFNISYIRGLFPENYFNDKAVSALDMKVKKLMPIDEDSRRLIDWMEKGAYDALQKKYLKTLLFCICESVDGPMIEEYAFSFTYSSDNEEVSMNVSRRGNKKQGATFKANAAEVTPEQMRFSACKMVRTLIQLMRTLDQMPEERTILMKLLYYDDITPEDYEPPFFKKCTESEYNSTWTKDPLQMDVGNVNSKHLVLALKVKSILDPCEDENDNNQEDDEMSLGADSARQDIMSSDSEVGLSGDNQYIVLPIGKSSKVEGNSIADEDNTQDSEAEEKNTARIRDWICSRHLNTVDLADILTSFPDISFALTEEIVGKLIKEGLISSCGRDSYMITREKDINCATSVIKEEIDVQVNQQTGRAHKTDGDDLMYTKALYHALQMDYITIAKLQTKLEGEANQTTIRRMIDKMAQDGYIQSKSCRKLGKRVIHTELTSNKFLEIKSVLENTATGIESKDQRFEFNAMDSAHESHQRNGSTCAGLHSIGSDFTRTRVISAGLQNVSIRSGQTSLTKTQDKGNTPTSKPVPISSLESGINRKEKAREYDRIPLEADVSVCSRSTQNKRIRKIDSVKDPILQNIKRQKNSSGVRREKENINTDY